MKKKKKKEKKENAFSGMVFPVTVEKFKK